MCVLQGDWLWPGDHVERPCLLPSGEERLFQCVYVSVCMEGAGGRKREGEEREKREGYRSREGEWGRGEGE